MAVKKSCTNRLSCCCSYSFLLLILLSGALLTCFWFLNQSLINSHLSKKLSLSEKSESVDLWKNPPADIYRKFYFFNITNLNEMLKDGKKPNLIEIGPYTYREKMEKRNLVYSPDGTKVNYTSVSTLYFDPDLSNGTQYDTFTFLSLLDMVVKESSGKLTKTQMFRTKTVEEFISGFENPFVNEMALKLGKRIERIGLYSEKNGTELNHFEAYTGTDNINNLGKLISWNGLKELNYWKNNANAINGSDGSKYPPNVKKDQKLYFFNPDLCRSFSLQFANESEIEGVKTYEFRLAQNIFSNNETLNPLYDDFCPKSGCLGSGVQSIQECRKNIPVVISLPHFLHADKKFQKGVNGLDPDENKHDYIVNIEPLTGTSVKSNIRIQFNYDIKKKNENLKLKDVLLPLFWIELDINTHPHIKTKFVKIQNILSYLSMNLIVIVGGILVFFSITMFIFLIHKNIKKSKLTNKYADIEKSKPLNA